MAKKNFKTVKKSKQKLTEQVTMEKLTGLCKRRGFIFPACEVYGGFANAYSYGPYGVELKNNLKKLWWKKFVQDRADMVGIDGPIILHPKLWEASGHTTGFSDAMVDCKKCKKRFRADHLVEELTGEDMEGELERMTQTLKELKAKCPECGAFDWTEARDFNMMFETKMNGIEGEVYLRPETAGAIFVEFKNILDSMRVKIPFGIAQIGKAFRNEIVAGNFTFRLREFEQMEIEYFIDPKMEWKKIYDQWLDQQEEFILEVGAEKRNLRRYEHPKAKLSHYSKKTVDIEYRFPFGFKELFGLANRTDFDLSQHSKFSNEKLEYFDPVKNRRYIPHVLEPTFGMDRTILVALLAAYREEKVEQGERVVLKFPKHIAPIKAAIFPLLKNKPELVKKAKQIFDSLKNRFVLEFDDHGNIGKRYRRQDEIGTPYCITVDFDTLKDKTVTIRDRDSMRQERVKINDIEQYISE
ncbi:MAG: glycine--tRNA ligase [Candidatus Moranbacteria bacterium]|nr:glycine--tRNA ligase [Candidatus Moranbacteria bacterium]